MHTLYSPLDLAVEVEVEDGNVARTYINASVKLNGRTYGAQGLANEGVDTVVGRLRELLTSEHAKGYLTAE